MRLIQLHEWKDLVRHYAITRGEVIRLITLAASFALILSFATISTAQTLEEQVDALVIAFLATIIGVLVHDAAHRIVALKRRLQPEAGINYYWLLFSLATMVLSKGALPLFFGEKIRAKPMHPHRLGHFTYHEGTDDLGAIALAGPIASAGLALIALGLGYIVGESIVFETIVRFSATYAILTFLPLPGLDGLMAFFCGRLLYAFLFGTLLGYFIFIQTDIGVLGTSVLALMVGGITWYIFYNFWEKNV
ncbi:hypothetical protein HY641_03700 [Candidatus Woesearchaeota archaeon]|nr:hypothetical protein [Candidatus Woesearchaeota archaeon]